MKSANGPLIQYELVYRLFPARLYRLMPDGFFHPAGRARGILVRSIGPGPIRIMHHLPEDYLLWKHEERQRSAMQ